MPVLSQIGFGLSFKWLPISGTAAFRRLSWRCTCFPMQSTRRRSVVCNTVQSELVAQSATAAPAASSAAPAQSSLFASLLQMIAGNAVPGSVDGNARCATSDPKALSAKLTSSSRSKTANAQSPGAAGASWSAQESGTLPAAVAASTTLNVFSAAQVPAVDPAADAVRPLETNPAVSRETTPVAQYIAPLSQMASANPAPGFAEMNATSLGAGKVASALETKPVASLEINPAPVAPNAAPSAFVGSAEAPLAASATPPAVGVAPVWSPSLAAESSGPAPTAAVPSGADARLSTDSQVSSSRVAGVATVAPENQPQLLVGALSLAAAAPTGADASFSTDSQVGPSPAAGVTTAAAQDQPQLLTDVPQLTGAAADAQPLEIKVAPFADKGQTGKVVVRTFVGAPSKPPGQTLFESAAASSAPDKPPAQSPSGSAASSGASVSAAATKLASSLPLDSGSNPSGFGREAGTNANSPSASRTVTSNGPVFDATHSGDSRHASTPLPNSHVDGPADAPPSNPPAAAESGPTSAPPPGNAQDDASGGGNAVTSLAAIAAGAQPSPTPTSGNTTVERATQPAGEAAVTQAASADPVQAARMVNGALQSEMHIGLRTQAFGSVEVHTVVHENQLGLTVGSEKGNLRGFLSSEVPALQAAFRQQDLRFETIRFLNESANAGSAHSGGANQQSQCFRQGRATAGEVTSEGVEAAAEENLDLTEKTRLSVLA